MASALGMGAGTLVHIALVAGGLGHPALQVVALGLLFNASGTLVNLVVAVASSRAAWRLRGPGRARALLQRATRVLFIALGLRLAYAARR